MFFNHLPICISPRDKLHIIAPHPPEHKKNPVDNKHQAALL